MKETNHPRRRRKKAGSEFDDRSKARRRALQALYQWQMTRQPGGEIVQQFLEEQDFRNVDVDWFRTLVEGVLKHRLEVDAALTECMERAPDSLDPMELVIARLGAYELQYHLETPMRAVINEAVELAKLFGSEQTSGFVNGVLDKFAASHRLLEYQASQASQTND